MITIFHISDLHFAEKFSDINLTSENTDKLKYIKGLEGHDIKIWLSFRKHLLSRIKQTNNDFRICVTGDLSRFGNIQSFNLASDLFFDESESDISKEFGLRIAREKFYIVPGNHDSYDKSYFKKNNLRTFNGIFHPTIVEYPIIKEETISNVNYSFFTLDSTYKKSAVSIVKKLGKGIVSKPQLDTMKGFLLGSKPSKSIKILCMHHSPIILDDKHDRNLMLEKSQELLKTIVNNKIDIVLCGHLHDDFYDILPLKKLIRLLPKKRGWSRIGKKIFQETQLNDYHQIEIKGQKVRYYDALAYYYIQNGKDILDYKKGEFNSLTHFQNYLHNLPEYTEFLDEFNSFKGVETALIMAGSTCQENSKSNSYIELKIEDDMKNIYVKRHRYNQITKQFDTKERTLKFN